MVGVEGEIKIDRAGGGEEIDAVGPFHERRRWVPTSWALAPCDGIQETHSPAPISLRSGAPTVDCGFLDSSAPREWRDRYQRGATGSTPRGARRCWSGDEASARRSLASWRRAVAEAIVLHGEAGIGKTAVLAFEP
jgi:hypothetical protein